MLLSTTKAAAIIAFLAAPQMDTAAAPIMFGQVTDSSGGRAPIDGAVISLELFASPDGTTTSNMEPTKLAVWQTRSGLDGRFLMYPGTDSLELPAGTVLSKGRLKVFAFGYQDGYMGEPFREIVLMSMSLGGRRIRIVRSLGEESPWLILRSQTPQSFSSQLDGWYAEINEGVHSGVWPNVEQAVQSYAPLLKLLDSNCRLVEDIFGDSPSGCQAASREFDLSSIRVEQTRVPPASPQPQQTLHPSQAPIRGGNAEAPMEGGMRQMPPEDKPVD
jgi:hypothetical protein